VIEDRLLDLLGYSVGMRWPCASNLVEQAFGAVGLEVAADLVELLTAVAHHPAGLADVAELGRQLQQAELAPCYLVGRGHVVLLRGWMVCCNFILTPPGSGVATPGSARADS